MAFREVTVVQVKEALRRWMRGEGDRTVAARVGIDRKTVRRYIAAAVELGVDRSGGETQLTEEPIGQVVGQVRPHRTDGHGEGWRKLVNEEEQIKAWVKQGLTVVKIGILLERRGVKVPARTLARFAVERCGEVRPSPPCASTTRRPASNSRWTSVVSGCSSMARGAGCAKGSSPTR
jgi:transposase